jgi:hypothetical protein
MSDGIRIPSFRSSTVKTGSVSLGIGLGRWLMVEQGIIDLGHGHQVLLRVVQVDGHRAEGAV